MPGAGTGNRCRTGAVVAPSGERLSSLIGDIYDTALDHTRWPHVLRGIAGFVRGPAAMLYAKDLASRTGNTPYGWGVDPQFTRSYFETYIRFDPFTVGQFVFPLGEIRSVTDLMPHDEFRTCRFYREWVEPQGWTDIATVVLDKSTTSYAVFSVVRSLRDGVVDEEMCRRMALLVPHVRRAVVIGNVMELRKVEAASLADTLDGLTAAMYLVDATGRVVHANASGRALLEAGEVLRPVGDGFETADRRNDRALRDLLAAVAAGDADPGARGIVLPGRQQADDGERYVLYALPLTSGARREAGASWAAVAAVFVRKATLDLASPPEVVASTYGLTPSELRVLLATVEVSGVRAVAEALGISQATVRTHLRRLFAKTGTSRQSELVKIVAAFASPLQK